MIKKRSLGLFAIVFIGFLLRTYKLGAYSLWFDEAATIINSQHLKTMLGEIGKTFTYPSPLYSIFIFFWQRLGTTEVILRYPSVIFGTLAIVMIYFTGKELFNKKIGLTAAFLLSVSPFNIYYSREVKGYAMLSFFVLLAIYFLIKAIRDNKTKFWIGYCVCMAVNIYLHYVSIFILATTGLYFLIFIGTHKSRWKKWLITNAALLILLIPWIINMILLLQARASNSAQPWMPGWLRDFSFALYFYTLKNFSAGYNAPLTISILISFLFAAFSFIGLLNPKKLKPIMLVCFSSFLTMLLLYYFSKFIPIYSDRYLIFASTFYYLLVAKGFYSAQINKPSKSLLVVFFLCLTIITLSSYYKDAFASGFDTCVSVVKKKDYRGAADQIKDNFREGDMIFHTHRSSALPFVYYLELYPDKSSTEPSSPLSKINKSIVLRFDKEKNIFLPYEYREQKCQYIDRSPDINIYEQKRVWLIYSGWVLRNFTRIDSEETKIVSEIEKHYKRIGSQYLDGIFIFLYEQL